METTHGAQFSGRKPHITGTEWGCLTFTLWSFLPVLIHKIRQCYGSALAAPRRLKLCSRLGQSVCVTYWGEVDRVKELGRTNHIEGHALIQWILLVLCQQQESVCMPECRCGFPFVWAGFDKLWRIPSAQQYGAKCACCVSKRTCQVVKKCQYRQERSEDVQS